MRAILLSMVLLFSTPAWAHEIRPDPKPAAVKKVKIFRSNPHRFMAIRFAGMNPWAVVDDEDLAPIQRRHRFNVEPDSDISDRVRWRLWLARNLAIRKYLETHHKPV